MKKILLCLATTLSLGSYGQVDFRDLTFDEALKHSLSESRIIFLQFEADDCDQCNEVADKGLSDGALSRQINSTFLPLKITATHPDRGELAERYNLEHGFGTFFINSNGVLLHRFARTTSRAQDYLDQLDLALNKAGEALKVDELEREYRNGNKSPGFLESLLLKKRSLGLATGALLDEYVELLPADSLHSVHTLAFLAQMAPLLDSKTYKLMRQDGKAFNTAWMSLPMSKRVAINREIMSRSLEIAIEQKSETRAYRVAQFSRAINFSNPVAAAKAYDYQLLRYFEKTGDSARYLHLAIPYYNRYFMTLSVDSIKGADSLALRKRLDLAPRRDSVLPNGTIRRIAAVRYAPVAQHFAAELNTGARNVYKMSRDAEQLRTALEWSARAAAFYESPEVLNTHARLWYRLGNKDQAVAVMEKALRLRRDRGYPTQGYEAALERIKKEQPLDD